MSSVVCVRGKCFIIVNPGHGSASTLLSYATPVVSRMEKESRYGRPISYEVPPVVRYRLFWFVVYGIVFRASLCCERASFVPALAACLWSCVCAIKVCLSRLSSMQFRV